MSRNCSGLDRDIDIEKCGPRVHGYQGEKKGGDECSWQGVWGC